MEKKKSVFAGYSIVYIINYGSSHRDPLVRPVGTFILHPGVLKQDEREVDQTLHPRPSSSFLVSCGGHNNNNNNNKGASRWRQQRMQLTSL